MDPLSREKFDEKMEALAQKDAAAGRERPWHELAKELLHADVPPLAPELIVILNARAGCGSDANGKALRSELDRYLDDQGIADEGERAAYHDLVQALDSESARVTAEEMAARQPRE